MDWLFIFSQLLWASIAIALIVGQYRLGSKIYELKAVLVWSERRIADLESKSVVKKPAVRKAAVKKEVK